MTSQHRIFLDLQDVLMIRLSCRACGASFSVAPNALQNIDAVCQNCSEPWFLKEDTDWKHLKQLVGTIAALQQRGDGTSCHIQIEVEKPT